MKFTMWEEWVSTLAEKRQSGLAHFDQVHDYREDGQLVVNTSQIWR